MMDQPNLTPFPPGRYFANLFSSAEINDWAIAQFFHDAGRYFGGQIITVRVDPIMRDGEQHGWQLFAWAMREQELEELEADELRADAARYRWLRDHSCPPHNFYISVPDEFAEVRYAGEQVDAYIDAARAVLGDQ